MLVLKLSGLQMKFEVKKKKKINICSFDFNKAFVHDKDILINYLFRLGQNQ